MRKRGVVLFLVVCLLLIAIGLRLPARVKADLFSTKVIINRQRIALIVPMQRQPAERIGHRRGPACQYEVTDSCMEI